MPVDRGFKVVRTVSCDTSNQLVLSNAVTPTVVHFADVTQRQDVALNKLKGTFSDSDVKFDFYEDGRLKDFNSTSTGEGEEILKTVITVAAAFFAADGGRAHANECADLKKDSDNKPLTIIYGGEIDVTKAGVAQVIEPDITSRLYAAKYKPVIGTVCATMGRAAAPAVPVTAASTPAMLHLREPAIVHIKVNAGGGSGCTEGPAWEGDVAVAQLGKEYDLPIPSPVIFGKEITGASFAESGALTGVQFTSSTGVGQALNVASAVQTASQPESVAQKAADMKAEADLIAQQQRLVQCIADPKNCK